MVVDSDVAIRPTASQVADRQAADGQAAPVSPVTVGPVAGEVIQVVKDSELELEQTP